MQARRAEEQGARAGVIELKLRDLAQLFDSLDPSPFHERDLDPKAAEFIGAWAHDYPRNLPLELVVHLAEPPRDRELAASAESAIQSYFAELAQTTRRELRMLFSVGRTSLLIGLAFLVACTAASRLLARLGDPQLFRIGAYGLEIAGWVAMWRPFEIFLYDWWPVLRRRRHYERLASMRVTLRIPVSTGERPPAHS
jgi:hypothetical protein